MTHEKYYVMHFIVSFFLDPIDFAERVVGLLHRIVDEIVLVRTCDLSGRRKIHDIVLITFLDTGGRGEVHDIVLHFDISDV